MEYCVKLIYVQLTFFVVFSQLLDTQHCKTVEEDDSMSISSQKVQFSKGGKRKTEQGNVEQKRQKLEDNTVTNSSEENINDEIRQPLVDEPTRSECSDEVKKESCNRNIKGKIETTFYNSTVSSSNTFNETKHAPDEKEQIDLCGESLQNVYIVSDKDEPLKDSSANNFNTIPEPAAYIEIGTVKSDNIRKNNKSLKRPFTDDNDIETPPAKCHLCKRFDHIRNYCKRGKVLFPYYDHSYYGMSDEQIFHGNIHDYFLGRTSIEPAQPFLFYHISADGEGTTMSYSDEIEMAYEKDIGGVNTTRGRKRKLAYKNLKNKYPYNDYNFKEIRIL